MAGDILLLCTDGLSRYVKESEIVAVVRRTTDLQTLVKN